MVKLKNLISENRKRRIDIAQKLVIDRYLEPLIDACAELEYRINNSLNMSLVSDEDVKSAIFMTNGDWEDVKSRLKSMISDKILTSKGHSFNPGEEDFVTDSARKNADQMANKAVTASTSIDTIGVISQNMPLIRRYNFLISKFMSGNPNSN